MNTPTTETIYEQLGISKEVWAFGQKTEEKLKERFEEFDRNAEYNQLKVIHAMQENRVSEGCFNYVSGYGYNDQGRDTLEDVYASVFHTEAALVRRSLAEHMRLRLRSQRIFVLETHCYLRLENHMIHLKK